MIESCHRHIIISKCYVNMLFVLAKRYRHGMKTGSILNDKILKILLTEFREKYGDGFENICYKGLEDDLVITIYAKADTA